VLLLSVLVMLLVRPNWLLDVGFQLVSGRHGRPRSSPPPTWSRPCSAGCRLGGVWLDWCWPGGAGGGLALDLATATAPLRCCPAVCRSRQPGGGTAADPAHARGDGDGPLRRDPAGAAAPAGLAAGGTVRPAAAAGARLCGPADGPVAGGPADSLVGAAALPVAAALVAAGAALAPAGAGWPGPHPGVAPLAAGRRPAATGASMGGICCWPATGVAAP